MQKCFRSEDVILPGCLCVVACRLTTRTKAVKPMPAHCWGRTQGWNGQSGHSGECPKGRLQAIKKMLNSAYGERCNLYMKKSILKLYIYQNFAAFAIPVLTSLHLLEFIGKLCACCKDAPWFCVENMPPDVRPEFKSHVNKYRVE